MDNKKDSWPIDQQIVAGQQAEKALPSANKVTWNIFTGGLVAVLVVVTFLQLLEVSRLKGYVEAAQINSASAQTSSPAPSASPRRPASGLPAQVGGC